MPDAADYGDQGADSVGHVAAVTGGLCLPWMGSMGLGHLTEVRGVPPVPPRAASGSWGRMAIASPGKDTMIGHWELMGHGRREPFPTYPKGFPAEVIEPLERAIGRRVLGNCAASGTEIIRELGAEHLRTGRPIVYTSADSVLQVAAHEETIPVKELYDICTQARRLLQGRHEVGRVIARPFVGRPPDFTRTPHRRDYPVAPPRPTVLDLAREAGLPVTGVGKIEDIFQGRGLTASWHTDDNRDGLDRLTRVAADQAEGIIFCNLVDFDQAYGHRLDAAGYARALAEADAGLGLLAARLRSGDLLAVCADHGCDPTTPSTDHSREYVPLLVCGPGLRPGVGLGTRSTLADLGATVAAWLGLAPPPWGDSLLERLSEEGEGR